MNIEQAKDEILTLINGVVPRGTRIARIVRTAHEKVIEVEVFYPDDDTSPIISNVPATHASTTALASAIVMDFLIMSDREVWSLNGDPEHFNEEGAKLLRETERLHA